MSKYLRKYYCRITKEFVQTITHEFSLLDCISTKGVWFDWDVNIPLTKSRQSGNTPPPHMYTPGSPPLNLQYLSVSIHYTFAGNATEQETQAALDDIEVKNLELQAQKEALQNVSSIFDVVMQVSCLTLCKSTLLRQKVDTTKRDG